MLVVAIGIQKKITIRLVRGKEIFICKSTISRAGSSPSFFILSMYSLSCQKFRDRVLITDDEELSTKTKSEYYDSIYLASPHEARGIRDDYPLIFYLYGKNSAFYDTLSEISDFIDFVTLFGYPPKVIWLRTGIFAKLN